MARPLADAHIRAQARLRTLTANAVASAWRGLPAYNEANVAPFLRATLPTVAAAQKTSVALTQAYVGRSLTKRPAGIDAAGVVGPAARAGTPPEEVYRRPFVTTWTALKAGKPYEDAVAAGLARATSAAAMDVQLASRATFAAVQGADSSIRGFQRVADGGACAFCLSIDGAFVKSADAMALHNNCGCSLEPIIGEVAASSLPDDVAVHQHGELGAVLTDPHEHFTTI